MSQTVYTGDAGAVAAIADTRQLMNVFRILGRSLLHGQTPPVIGGPLLPLWSNPGVPIAIDAAIEHVGESVVDEVKLAVGNVLFSGFTMLFSAIPWLLASYANDNVGFIDPLVANNIRAYDDDWQMSSLRWHDISARFSSWDWSDAATITAASSGYLWLDSIATVGVTSVTDANWTWV